MQEFFEIIGAGILVFLIFLGMASPVFIICLVYYLKKRFDHKQVMAAIEKGAPLSDLKPLKPTGPLWIKNLTAGITALIISAGLGLIGIGFIRCGDRITDDDVWGCFVVALILFAIGISRLIRGLLQRKAEKAQLQVQPSNQLNTARS